MQLMGRKGGLLEIVETHLHHANKYNLMELHFEASAGRRRLSPRSTQLTGNARGLTGNDGLGHALDNV